MHIPGRLFCAVLQDAFWLLLALACSVGGCAPGESERPWDSSSGTLLPDARSDDGVRFEIIRHNTRYPERPDFGAGVNCYDYRHWFTSLLNVEVLPPDWESRLARAPRWSYVVDWRDKGRPLDSLLLRFTAGSRVVHVTDNRSDLIVAVRMPEERLSLENPEEAVRGLCREYLAGEVSGTWHLKMVPIEGNPELLRGFLIAPETAVLDVPVAEEAAFYVGPSFAAFAFTKTYPGAVPRYGVTRPLFSSDGGQTLHPAVATVRRLLKDEHWDPAALAAALCSLEEALPRDPHVLQTMAVERPIENDAIDAIGTSIYPELRCRKNDAEVQELVYTREPGYE